LSGESVKTEREREREREIFLSNLYFSLSFIYLLFSLSSKVGVSDGVITRFISFDFNRCWSSHYDFFFIQTSTNIFSLFLSKNVYIKRKFSTYRYSLRFSILFIILFLVFHSHLTNRSRRDWTGCQKANGGSLYGTPLQYISINSRWC
jgi:hypothetical protein